LIDLSNVNVCNNAVIALSTADPPLTYVCFNGCARLSTQSFLSLLDGKARTCLKYLGVAGVSRMKDEDVSLVDSRCTSLQQILLPSHISGEEVGDLIKSSSLKSVAVIFNSNINSKVFEFGAMSFLISLGLVGCAYVDDQTLFNISKYCHSLKTLNISRCILVTDKGLCAVGESCLLMESFACYDVTKVTSKGIENFTKFAMLHTFVASGIWGIKDDGLIPLLKNCLKLSVLHISGCGITDAICQSARDAPTLKRLVISDCKAVSVEGIELIAQSKSLKYLNCEMGMKDPRRRVQPQLTERTKQLEILGTKLKQKLLLRF